MEEKKALHGRGGGGPNEKQIKIKMGKKSFFLASENVWARVIVVCGTVNRAYCVYRKPVHDYTIYGRRWFWKFIITSREIGFRPSLYWWKIIQTFWMKSNFLLERFRSTTLFEYSWRLNLFLISRNNCISQINRQTEKDGKHFPSKLFLFTTGIIASLVLVFLVDRYMPLHCVWLYQKLDDLIMIPVSKLGFH